MGLRGLPRLRGAMPHHRRDFNYPSTHVEISLTNRLFSVDANRGAWNGGAQIRSTQMGDRVLVLCTDDGKTADAAVYAHWQGEDAANIIKATAPRLRQGDASYSAGAICAAFWKHADRGHGYVSVGLLPAPADLEPATLCGDYNHGDAGVYVINTQSGVVTNFRCYSEGAAPFTISLGGE